MPDILNENIINRSQKFMNRVVFLMIVSMSLTTALKAQEKQSDLKNKRASYLSKQMSISLTSAYRLVEISDKYVESSNRIYHDSSLTSDQKVKRLQFLQQERNNQIEAISATEGKLDGKDKLAPLFGLPAKK